MKIRIEAPKVDKPGPHTAHGTRIFLDDQELHEVGDIIVKYPAHKGPVSVDFSLLATENLSLEANAEVNITLVAPPGFEIVTYPGEDGVTRYECVRFNPER